MGRSLTATERVAELQSLSGKAHLAKASLQKVSCPGALVLLALHRAGIDQKAAAADMGISESLLTRQLHDAEHLSWQRLQRLPRAFWRELVPVMVREFQLGTVTTHIELDERASA